MKNQLSIKSKLIYFISQKEAVKVSEIVETFSDYSKTNVLGNLLSLVRKGMLKLVNAERIKNDAVLDLTGDGSKWLEERIIFE